MYKAIDGLPYQELLDARANVLPDAQVQGLDWEPIRAVVKARRAARAAA